MALVNSEILPDGVKREIFREDDQHGFSETTYLNTPDWQEVHTVSFQRFERNLQNTSGPHSSSHEYMIKADSPLNDDERKWCRCLLHVQEKGGTYNPYAVCSKTVGSHSGMHCAPHYDYDALDYGQLQAFAELHHMDSTLSREELVRQAKAKLN